MEIILLLLTMSTFQISAALRFRVNQEDCGRSINLSKENRVIIDYNSTDFLNKTGFCVIDLTTDSSSEMICITTIHRRMFIDLTCSWSLTYHIDGYDSYGKQYSCNDFNRRKLCKKRRKVSLAYSDNYMFRNVSISVQLFSEKYIPTTTMRPWSSWSSWSDQSWSSWTSSDDNDEKSNKGRSGTVVAVIIGAVVAVLLIIACFVAKCDNNSTPVNQNETDDPQDRYSSENQHITSGTRQTTSYPGVNFHQTHSPDSPPLQQFSQGPPSYEEYQKHQPLYKPVTHDVQPGPPNTDNQTVPSAPPPPYAGYRM